jgi:hypothetical protein
MAKSLQETKLVALLWILGYMTAYELLVSIFRSLPGAFPVLQKE